ncbi:MAG TPA: hypothetical protein VGW10_09560 [Solirubrobacteraceae bacterium]|nr:hypothetical protein [Solirubrobacteraceae bacterium]
MASALTLQGDPQTSNLELAAAGVPDNRVQPAISGDERLGGEILCGRGDWDDPEGAPYAVTYAWSRDGTAVGGATEPEYAVTSADIGHGLRCTVTATGSEGTAAADSTTVFPSAPVALTSPAVSGDPRLEQTLTCNPATWNDAGVPPYPKTTAWLRDGAPIAGSASATYTLAKSDVGHAISCRVSVGTLASSFSSSVFPTAPANRISPAISGDTRLGGTVTCSRGTWDDEGIDPYAVTTQWTRDGADVVGSTGSAYLIGLGDIGHHVACRVTAEGLTVAHSGGVFPTSPASRSAPFVTGDPRLGRTLTCDRGSWDDEGRAGDYEVAYEWYHDSLLVADAQQYVVAAMDVGHSLHCRVVAEGVTSASSQSVFPSAPSALTPPQLSGEPKLERSLTCSRGVWDDGDVDPYPVQYQWLRDGNPIPAATAVTHTVGTDDVGHGLACRVRAADLTDAQSQTAFPQGPGNRLVPAISGDPYVGSDLTCSRGDWDDATAAPYDVTYQWFRDGTEIAGETSPTYSIPPDDLHHGLSCRVTAETLTQAHSASVWVTDQPTGGTPVNLIAPVISGDTRLRGTLTCSRGSWNDTAASRYPVTYRWQRNGINITGATTSQRTIAALDMGASLSCVVTAAGQTSAHSGSVAPRAPEALLPPSVSGDPRVRRTLSCTRGTWDDRALDPYAVTYRWLRNGTPIDGATAPTYQLTADDVNEFVTCEARAEGLVGAQTSGLWVGAPRVLNGPSLSGHPRLRQTLTCGRGTWDDLEADRYAVTRQWLRNGNPIAGATGAEYVLTSADVDSGISCVVRAEDATDAHSPSLSVSRPANRVAPGLTGHARVRQLLTCTRGDWDDTAADRYAVTYAWLRDGTPIPGASSATYAIVADDVSHSLSCRVRAEDFTDAHSPSEHVSTPENRVSPALSGSPLLNRTLTCSRGDWDDTAADRYAVTYEWFRGGELIAGATTATHTVVRDDVNSHLTCRVTAEGSTQAFTGSVFAASPGIITAPTITGQPHLRGQLACGRGTWDDTPAAPYAISYQWYRGGVAINGATENAYVVSVADLNRFLSCSAIAEGLAESFAPGVFAEQPQAVTPPRVEGIAHPRRALTCEPGEWNDSAGSRYAVAYQWRRNFQEIPGADAPDYIVTAEDVDVPLDCVVTAEGDPAYTATASYVFPTWEPLRLALSPEIDAVDPAQADAYVLRIRNLNPVAVPVQPIRITLPGGFSYRPGTTSGALTSDPQAGGVGSLTLTWNEEIEVPAIGDAVIRVGVTAATAIGDHYAQASVDPAFGFTAPATGQTARITVEGPEPAGGACTVLGTAGAEVLVGTAGNDVICGLGGDDLITGGEGADTIWGGDGDDRIDGGGGADTLRGGDGADVIPGSAGADVVRGGGGLDTMSYATRLDPVTVTLGEGDGDDGAPGEGDTLGSDVEIVRGGRSNDTLTGGPGEDELYGRAGNDRLDGAAGDDLLDGGDGDDTLLDTGGIVDRLFCGGGLDSYAADLLDRIVACETEISGEGGGIS